MLTFVPTPIGNLSDITLRSLETFQNSDTILCEDTRVTKQLIDLLSRRSDLHVDATFISFHEHNQQQRLSEFTPEFFQTGNVVYVSDAGMPAISDPGAKLVQYCRDNAIEYDVLPGPSAAVTAFAASGFEGEFLFYGFLSREKRNKDLQRVLQSPCYAIVYEAPHRIEKLLDQIKKTDPERELFLAKEISKKYQSFFYGKAADIEISNPKGEWVAVIAPAEQNGVTLDQNEIMQLQLPLKQKAKLLAKTGTKSAKEWYNTLIKESEQ